MPAIEESEIEAGLVVFTDNFELRRNSDCLSKTMDPSADIKKNHSILIAEVDRSRRVCVSFPIFLHMKEGPSRFQLINSLRRNWPSDGVEHDYFVHRRHSYEIPFDTLIRASAVDASIKGYRRFYASAGHEKLRLLADNHQTNRNALHPMRPLLASSRSR